MQHYFHNKREIIEIVKNEVTFEQFKKMLNENKPKEIFNSEYSVETPFWYITDYLDENSIKYYANIWSDKTAEIAPIDTVYQSWLLQGLEHCFFNATSNESQN